MASLPSLAQCNINYSYNPVRIISTYPQTLPDAVQGFIYNQDLTFVLPLDTTDGGLTVTFTDFHIVPINLPLGSLAVVIMQMVVITILQWISMVVLMLTVFLYKQKL